MSSSASKVFHLLVVIYYYLVNVHIIGNVSPPILRDFQPIRDGIVILLIQMSTFWALVFNNVFFACALVEDVMELASCRTARSKLKKFNDALFNNAVWPATFMVVINFWILYAYTPRLLDPYHVLFDYISWEVNHVIHTYVAVLIVVEALLHYRPHSGDVLATVKTLTTYVCLYFAVAIVTQPFGTIWTYPFYRDMSCCQWALYVAANVVLALAAHFAASVLNSLRWGRSILTTGDYVKAE